jgi:hypothetical protein
MFRNSPIHNFPLCLKRSACLILFSLKFAINLKTNYRKLLIKKCSLFFLSPSVSAYHFFLYLSLSFSFSDCRSLNLTFSFSFTFHLPSLSFSFPLFLSIFSLALSFSFYLQRNQSVILLFAEFQIVRFRRHDTSHHVTSHHVTSHRQSFCFYSKNGKLELVDFTNRKQHFIKTVKMQKGKKQKAPVAKTVDSEKQLFSKTKQKQYQH